MILRQPRLPGAWKVPKLSRCSLIPNQRQRSLHTRPQLAHEDKILQHGLNNLFSTEGFSTAWTQQMDHLLYHLNRLTVETDDANTVNVKDLALRHARTADKASLFNYASQLHNHHFFFEALRTGFEAEQDRVSKPTEELRRSVLKDYSEWDHMRDGFIDTADAMFGPGHVWLVRAKNSDVRTGPLWRWSVLTTYLAGSPYHQAHARRQATDTNVLENARLAAQRGMSRRDFERQFQVSNTVGSFGALAAKDEATKVRDAGGVEIVPALCVSTWEHVWLKDYGVGGKRKFLETFWETINWDKVRQRVEITQVGVQPDEYNSVKSRAGGRMYA